MPNYLLWHTRKRLKIKWLPVIIKPDGISAFPNSAKIVDWFRLAASLAARYM